MDGATRMYVRTPTIVDKYSNNILALHVVTIPNISAALAAHKGVELLRHRSSILPIHTSGTYAKYDKGS